MKVELIMSTRVMTAHPETTLAQLGKILKQAPYHHLLVEESGVLVGIISDRDCLAASSPFHGTEEECKRDEDRQQMKASEIMSAAPVTIDRTTSVDTASILLLENDISCLPVVDDDGVIEGILTWKDILKCHVYADLPSVDFA